MMRLCFDLTQQWLEKWKVLIFGQFIALSLACCSAASATLQNMTGIQNMPLFQIAGGYFVLGFYALTLDRTNKKKNSFDDENDDDDDDDDDDEKTCSMLTLHHSKKSLDQCVDHEQSALTLAPTPTGETTCLLSSSEKRENSDHYEYLIHEYSDQTENRKSQKDHQEKNKKKKSVKNPKAATFTFPFVKRIKLHSPWYFYALLAFLDVQANFFVVLSFRYTTLISTNLLTSLSVVSVFITSKVILKRVFHFNHFLGGFLMLVGAFFIVSSDWKEERAASTSAAGDNSTMFFHENDSDGDIDTTTTTTTTSRIQHGLQHHFIGDFFAVTAALVFGLNDTLAEYCILNSTVEEYLAMLGIFGYIFSIGESFILERSQIYTFFNLILEKTRYSTNDNYNIDDPNDTTIINLVTISIVWMGYIISLFIFYTMASYFLTMSDATLLNLSLQFSNMWTMIFSIVVQHIFPTPMFYCAVVLIFIGVLIYEKGGNMMTMIIGRRSIR